MFSMLLSSEEDFQVPMSTPEPGFTRHHSMIHHPSSIPSGPTIAPQSLLLPPPQLAPPILPPLPPQPPFQQVRIGIPSLTSIPSISGPFPRPNQPTTSKRPDDDVEFVFEKPVKRRKLESGVPSAAAGMPPSRVTDEKKLKMPSEAASAQGLVNPTASGLKPATPAAALLSLPKARPPGIPEANVRVTSLPSMDNFAFPTSFPSGQTRYSRSSPSLSPRQLPETIAPNLLQRGHSQPLLNNSTADSNPQKASAGSNVVSGVEGNSGVPHPAPANNTNSMVDGNSIVTAGPEPPPPSAQPHQLHNGAAQLSTPTPAGNISGRADGQNLGLSTWKSSAIANWSAVGTQENPKKQENVPEERPREQQQLTQQDPRAIMSMILARTEQAQSWSSSSTESAHGDNDNVNSGTKPAPPLPSQSVQKVEPEQMQQQGAQNNSPNAHDSSKNCSEPQPTPIPFTPAPSIPVQPAQVQSPPKQPVQEQLMQQSQMQCQPQLQAQTQMLQHQVQVQAGQRVGHHQSTPGVKGPCRVCLALRQQAALQNAAAAAAAAAGGGLSPFPNPGLVNGLMGGSHGHGPHNGTGYNFVFVPTPMQAGHTTPGAQFPTPHTMNMNMNMNAGSAGSPALMGFPPHQQYMLQNAQAQGMMMAPPALPAQPQMEAMPKMADQTSQPMPNKSKPQAQQTQPPRKFAHQEPSAGKHIIVDIADTAMEAFPFGKVAKRHQVSVDKVRNIFEAVVAIPFLRIPADKRRAGKIGQDRVKKYVMTKKDLEKQNAVKGKKGEGVDGQPSMYEIARAMEPGEAPREWTHGFQGAW